MSEATQGLCSVSKQISTTMTTQDGSTPSRISRQILAAIAVNILSICGGISASWTSVVEKKLEVPNNHVRPEAITPEEFTWVASTLYLGAFLGIFIWNKVADRFGRKINTYALALTQILGWLGIILSSSVTQLTISRLILGLGVAGIITNSQLYINETANEHIKGPLCALLIIAKQIGFISVAILGWILPYPTFNMVCITVPIIFICLFFWLPESPLYLLMTDKHAEAEKVLLWFNHGNEIATKEKMQALTQSLDKIKPPPLKELVATRKTTMASFTAVVMLAGHQLCGNPVISSYTVKIFKMSNTSNDYHSAILVSIVQLVTACVMAATGRYAPKKLVMVVSYLMAFLAMASLSLFFFWNESQFKQHFTWVPVCSLIIFIMCYSSGISPVSYMLLSEMFPARSLNNVISVGLMVAIPLAFAATKSFAFLDHTFTTGGLFLIYAVVNAMLMLFVLIFVNSSERQ